MPRSIVAVVGGVLFVGALAFATDVLRHAPRAVAAA